MTTVTRGRPRKRVATKVKKVDFENAVITPVANGYTVQSKTSGDNIFVFNDIEEVFNFLRTSLKSTAEQTAVLNGI